MRALFIALLILAALGAVVYVWYVFGIKQLEAPLPLRIEREQETGLKESWEQMAPMPTPRTEVTAAEVLGKMYVVGGLSGFAQTLAAVEVYDPVSDSWEEAPPLPQALHHAMAASAGEYLYVFGGFTNITFSPTSRAFRFDPRSQTWQELALLPEARGAGAAVAHNGSIYLFGGVISKGVTISALRYDIGEDSYTEIEPMSDAREHLAAAAMGEKIYVAGGRRGGLSGNRGTLEIFDTKMGEWTSGPAMPTARGGIAAAAYQGTLHVFGGEQATKTFNEHEVFDPQKNAWGEALAMPTSRHGLAAVTVGDGIYVIGGGRRPGLSVSVLNERYRVTSQ